MTEPLPLVPMPYDASILDASLGDGWPDLLTSAFRWMILGRALDRRMLGLQRQGRIGFYGPATGQEAVSVGAGLAVRPEDWVFPGLREQLLALVRGHPVERYAHHLFADARDPALGRQMPCHPSARDVRYVSMSSVIGTQISQAVGVGFAQRRARDPGATLAFFGDGASSSNDFHAGLNFAGVFGLPVVFCLTNNQWAISVPVERQTRTAILAEKSRAYGFPGTRIDGTDVVAVIASLRAALVRARSGDGPSLIEFVVFRMTPHSSSDDPTRYQPSDFLARGRATDPVDRLKELLERLKLLTPEAEARISEAADLEVRRAIEAAESTPPPPPESLTDGVFSSPRSNAG